MKLDGEYYRQYKVDPNHWAITTDLTKELACQIANDFILWKIDTYIDSEYRNEELWDAVKEDFENWTIKIFKIAEKGVLGIFRDFLRENGVWVEIRRDFRVEKTLQQLLREEISHDWTQDEISYERSRIKGRKLGENLIVKEKSHVECIVDQKGNLIYKDNNVKHESPLAQYGKLYGPLKSKCPPPDIFDSRNPAELVKLCKDDEKYGGAEDVLEN